MGPLVTCVLSSPNASGAAHGLLSEALHKPGGGSLARAGGLPELAYGEGQGHELHREEVFNDKSEQLHCSFGTCPPSRVMQRTPGNRSRQVAGDGHVDRRGEHPHQRPRDPSVDAARGARGGDRLPHALQRILHPQVPTRPRPAQQRKHAEEARRRRPTARPQSRLRAAAPPSGVAEGRPEPARAPAPALTPPAPRPARC